jgi:hypothetical protein
VAHAAADKRKLERQVQQIGTAVRDAIAAGESTILADLQRQQADTKSVPMRAYPFLNMRLVWRGPDLENCCLSSGNSQPILSTERSESNGVPETTLIGTILSFYAGALAKTVCCHSGRVFAKRPERAPTNACGKIQFDEYLQHELRRQDYH